jgi:hypothetical protein
LVSRGGTKRDEMGSVLSCCLQGRLVAVLGSAVLSTARASTCGLGCQLTLILSALIKNEHNSVGKCNVNPVSNFRN